MKAPKNAVPTLILPVVSMFSCMFPLSASADDGPDANPVVICEYRDSSLTVITDTASFGNNTVCEAPVTVFCSGNLNYDKEKYTNCISEWILYDINDGSSKPLVDRFAENIEYTIDDKGSYGVIFSYTLIDKAGMTYSYQTDSAVVTIKESELEFPDGFSPNGDGINDVFKMTKFQSIVSLEGEIYNRWGQVLHTFTLGNVREGWDGYYNGKVIRDGGYMLRIHARGSEGLEYDIKKVINVLKSFREQSE